MSLPKYLLFVLVALASLSCSNKKKKPLLPYLKIENDQLVPQWILPGQDLSNFVKLPNVEGINQNGELLLVNDTTKTHKIVAFISTEFKCETAEFHIDSLLNRFIDSEGVSFINIILDSADDGVSLNNYISINKPRLEKRLLLELNENHLNLLLKQTFNLNRHQIISTPDLHCQLYMIDKHGYLRAIYDGNNVIDVENIFLDSKIL